MTEQPPTTPYELQSNRDTRTNAAIARSSRSNRTYRGFSTPIAGSFAKTEFERVDCCSLACCGVLQSDRDRYLLTGIRPPSSCRRFWIHIIIPCTLFGLAGYGAFHIHSRYYNQLMVTGLVWALITYVILQCLKGRQKRISVRKELLWRLHQMERDRDNEGATFDESETGEPDPEYYNGQSSYDFNCAHFMVGCYNTDLPPRHHRERSSSNICRRMWEFFSTMFCGCCGAHIQLCGMCGLAQEARELEHLLPTDRRQIDYVSMQPMFQYYNDILRLRTERSSSLRDHCNALSQLSRSLITHLGTALVILMLLSLVPITRLNQWQWQNFLLLLATFGQAFILLYLVHWHWNKFDLSLDAVIKYFASGFILCTSLAMFFEMVFAIFLQLVMSIIMALFDIDVQTDEDGYQMSSYYTGIGFGHMPLIRMSKEYLKAFGKGHPIIFTIYLFVLSFFIAAFVEEMCKYFGYRMVEHPDFSSKEELEKAATVSVESDDNEKTDENAASASVDFSAQKRSAESAGSGTTVAMVTVALGFACCENLVYIFIKYGSSLESQGIVLIARCFFPVHPITAAIQSIGVCKRDIENDTSHQIGRIILPAVIMHGSFDFILLFLDFLSTLNEDNAEADSKKDVILGVLSFIIPFICMMAGIAYYFKESKAQKERLKILDRAATASEQGRNVV